MADEKLLEQLLKEAGWEQSYIDHIKTKKKEIANKVITLLQPFVAKPPNKWRVLDAGCGIGVVSIALAPEVESVVGCDIEEGRIEIARKLAMAEGIKNVEFLCANIDELPSEDDFDVVMLIEVVEHVRHPEKTLTRCVALMKNGGGLYLTTHNKLWPVEGHYNLPLVHFLPSQIGNIYLRLARKRGIGLINSKTREYGGIWLLSYPEIKRLLDMHPLRYTFGIPPRPRNRLYALVGKVIDRFPVLWNFAPGYIVVGTKQSI